jgi:hypothetical protein
VDFMLLHKLTAGIGGFGLEPLGNQTIYGQAMQASSAYTTGGQQAGQRSGSGMMPGGGMGSGMGGGVTMPPVSSMPSYNSTQPSVVSASALRDYGASVWISVPLHAGVSVSSVLSRSVPLHLTTVRVSLGVDVARLLFPGKRF